MQRVFITFHHTSSVTARTSLLRQAPAMISSSSLVKTFPVGLWGLCHFQLFRVLEMISYLISASYHCYSMTSRLAQIKKWNHMKSLSSHTDANLCTFASITQSLLWIKYFIWKLKAYLFNTNAFVLSVNDFSSFSEFNVQWGGSRPT